MKFRPAVKAAYAPAQIAVGLDDEQRPIVTAFIPQWQDAIRSLSRLQPLPAAETQWAFSREIGLPVLFIRWSDQTEIAMTFSPQMSRDVLTWWERQGFVDLVLCAERFEAAGEAPAAAATPQPDNAMRRQMQAEEQPCVRIADVPFMTTGEA